MKQSRFNVIDKGNQPTLAYNSYSGAIVALDAEYEKGLFENGASCPSEIVENLTNAGLLVPDGLDEIEHLKRDIVGLSHAIKITFIYDSPDIEL